MLNGAGKANEISSNVPDAVILKHRREIGESKRKLDEAQGIYRAAVKRAKAEGVDTTAMIELMVKRKRERDEVIAHYRNVFRYAEIEGAPLVSQLELFPQAASTITPEQQAEHNEWQAGGNGYEAGKAGRARDDNPFDAGEAEQVAWDNGWLRGQRALADYEGDSAEVATATPRRRRGRAAAYADN